MGEGVVSPVPSDFIFRFLPEQTELLLQFSNRTKVKYEVPGSALVYAGVVDVSQQPV